MICDKCQFNLNAYFINEPILKDGERQIFHLKGGDKLVYKLDKSFRNEKDFININSFNLRMTPYKMEVQMINKNNHDANSLIKIRRFSFMHLIIVI